MSENLSWIFRSETVVPVLAAAPTLQSQPTCLQVGWDSSKGWEETGWVGLARAQGWVPPSAQCTAHRGGAIWTKPHPFKDRFTCFYARKLLRTIFQKYDLWNWGGLEPSCSHLYHGPDPTQHGNAAERLCEERLVCICLENYWHAVSLILKYYN